MHNMMNPHEITKEFEKSICEYTGAPHAVAVNSCTMALLLACAWAKYKNPKPKDREAWNWIEIPKRTYVSVPQSIIHAGFNVVFRDEQWYGQYQLKPYQIWDSARHFTSGMYAKGTIQCLSFHTSKILGDTQGGAILHDDPEADAWLRKARFDGRTEGVAPKDDTFDMIAWHCYLSPDVSARLLWKMQSITEHNEPLPNDQYVDLSQLEIFK